MTIMKKTLIAIVLSVMMSLFMTSCRSYETVSYEPYPVTVEEHPANIYIVYDNYDWYQGFYVSYIYDYHWYNPTYYWTFNCYYPYWGYSWHHYNYWYHPHHWNHHGWHHHHHHNGYYAHHYNNFGNPSHFNNSKPVNPRPTYNAQVRPHNNGNATGSMSGRRPTSNGNNNGSMSRRSNSGQAPRSAPSPVYNRPINTSNTSRPSNTTNSRPSGYNNSSRPSNTSSSRPSSYNNSSRPSSNSSRPSSSPSSNRSSGSGGRSGGSGGRR